MISNIIYTLAPICLFVYKRLDTLKEAVKSLQKNELAQLSDLYIFSDAANDPSEIQAVNKVRDFCETVTGFKSVKVICAEQNLGLATSIIKGVSSVISKNEKIIVLEDDLVVSNNFLSFMNEALHYYKDKEKIFSITGYSSPMQNKKNKEVYFTKRGCSWGWGTWKEKWDTIDWNASDYESFIQNKEKQKQFNKMGSDLTISLMKQQMGMTNSWAIRWVYEQFKRDQYSVYPVVSKVSNEGFGDNATHTSKSNRNRFSTIIDKTGKCNFEFPDIPYLDPYFVNQFIDRYSIKIRAFYKLKSILNLM